MRTVLVTGSRWWDDREAVFSALEEQWRLGGGQLHILHGDATGADALAEEFCVLNSHRGVTHRKFRAEWEKWGRFYAGRRRNNEMVAAGADVCLAFPLPGSVGTRHCMSAASQADIEVVNCARPV